MPILPLLRKLALLLPVVMAGAIAAAAASRLERTPPQRLAPPAPAQEATVPATDHAVQITAWRVNGNPMAAGGRAIIAMADAMDTVATVPLTSSSPAGDSQRAELGQHWKRDASVMRSRGNWMILAATADSMIHDPDAARQVNLQNLRGNGLVMEHEGNALIAHGHAMIDEVNRAQAEGWLSPDLARQALDRAWEIVALGERLKRDGQDMQAEADRLLRSLGQS